MGQLKDREFDLVEEMAAKNVEMEISWTHYGGWHFHWQNTDGDYCPTGDGETIYGFETIAETICAAYLKWKEAG